MSCTLIYSIINSIFSPSSHHKAQHNRHTVRKEGQSDPAPPLCSVGKEHFRGDALCAFCSPVNLATIKYLCFLVELLTLLPQLVSSLPVSDDIYPSAHQRCPSLSAFFFPFSTPSLLPDLSSFRAALSAFLSSFMFSLINYDTADV